MEPTHAATLLTPADPLDQQTVQEAISAAERIRDLLAHEGWKYLLRGVKAYQDEISAQIMGSPPSTTAEVYSRAAGEMRGAAAIELIAEGIVKNGEAAEAQVRSREEGSG